VLAACVLLGQTGAATKSLAADADGDADPWAADMAAFEKQDAERPFEQGGIVFVGSSSIRLWDLGKWFPDLPVLNRGFGGSQIVDSVKHVDLLIVRHKPRLVVFYGGDNDVAGGKSAEQVHADFQALVAAVRKPLPEAQIVCISIKPSILRWEMRETQRAANKLIREECENGESLEFVDVWPAMLGEDGAPRKELFVEDGLHLNEAGYEIWVQLLRPHLKSE